MSQWKSNANTSGAPKWSASILQQGSGAANKAANVTGLVANATPGAWLVHGQTLHEVDGIFPITPGAKANTSGESKKVHGLGWALRTASEGQIITFTGAANGSGFVNGDAINVTGGSLNAVMTVTTNATGNLTGGTIYTAGLFPNTSAATLAFNRDQHGTTLIYANSTSALTNVGNANTINVTVTDTRAAAEPWGKPATGSFTSNATAGFGASPVTVTWTSNGVFSNTANSTNLTVALTNAANGAVIGSVTSSGLTLTTSSGGFAGAITLGGRAGRVNYELLVVDRHINATATSSVANSTYLPQ